MSTALVVGGGPNGLAAALALAAEGVQVTVLEAADEVGGGARSGEAIIPGLLHDHCSAIHPMAVGSQFLSSFKLHRYGLSWRWPEIDCVHPLDNGTAGVLHRSVEQTAAGLGRDGSRWRLAFGYPAARFDALSEDIMGPLLRFPHHPLMLARFGAPTVLPGSTFARLFRTEQGRALFGGVAAHAFRPLHYPMTSAIGIGIIAAGHRHGWAVAAGGSQSIINAMVALLGDLGGKIETGVRVQTASQLPSADVTMFDLAPTAVAGILGERLPRRVAHAFTRFRRGPGAFKVDFAVDGGVPWTNPDAHRAGTVHLAGTFSELAATEREIHAGRMPERPFVLVGQQYLADPQRSVGSTHPVWSYAHVPNGYAGDATEAIIAQIERFAPGFRECIVGRTVRTTTQMEAYNPNYVGGDIMTGAKDIRQLTFGPRITLSPYSIGVPGMYIFSAATPPGPGAHGMCGVNAARLALAYLARRAQRQRDNPFFAVALRSRAGGARGIAVEALAGLDAELARIHIGLQQVPRFLRQVPELFAVVVFDVECNVQADQIHHLKRSGLHAEVDLEHPVDILRAGNALGDYGQRLPLDGSPDAIEYEAGALPSRLEGMNAELGQYGQQGVEQAAVGLPVGHQVHRIHLRRHVEVHVAQTSFVAHVFGHQPRRVGRRVRGEDGVRRRRLVDLVPCFNLDLESLRDGFNDEPGVIQRLFERPRGHRATHFTKASVLHQLR